MTKVTFFTKDDKFTGFAAEGHAGYGSYGEDIVCASISVLIVNTINSIDSINHEDIDVCTDEEDGLILFNLKSNKQESTQILLQSLYLGLSGIQSEYGQEFIQVITKEVNDNVKA